MKEITLYRTRMLTILNFETEDIAIPFKTVLTGSNLPPQVQAVQSLGFQFKPACCGIYKVWV